MPATPQPDRSFAIQDDEQYQPVRAVADQRVPVPGGARAAWLACYASRPLGALRDTDERVVIVVHGALRDADRYLGLAQDAARRSGSAALIAAPQFLSEVDTGDRAAVPEGALYWSVEGWKGGYPALGPTRLSSFSAMDSLLSHLAGDAGRPAAVVIVGNSAGGQFVNRYAAVGRGPGTLAERGIPVRFIIANPSTYLYFDRQRPFAVPDGRLVNRWRYGFDGAPPYVEGGPRPNLARYLARDVTIVLGEQDADPGALLLEVSPAAMTQGRNRRERGVCYERHVRRLAREAGYPVRHRLIRRAGAGHAAADVLAAAQVREIMFG
jgi:hypothetical protein